jgi:hypothetical protein
MAYTYAPKKTKSRDIAVSLGYSDLENLIACSRADGLSYDEIIQITGLSEKTIFRNAPEHIKGQFVVQTPKRKEQIIKWYSAGIETRRKNKFERRGDFQKSMKEISIENMNRVKERLFGK